MATKRKPSLVPVTRKPAVKAEDFIPVWQKSSTVKEVAETLGISTVLASTKAASYRSKGIDLKKMQSTPNYDWDKLKQLAKDSLPK